MMIRSDLRLLESVEVEILVFDQRLAELGWQDERVKLLMTIPGISIVVATARKLACIAWRMLTSGEPYRYAPPQTTAAKLATLRIMATGEKRRGGEGKGVKCAAKLEGGSRSIRALDDVLVNEDLAGTLHTSTRRTPTLE